MAYNPELPLETKVCVFSFLTHDDFINAAHVCKSFYDAAKQSARYRLFALKPASEKERLEGLKALSFPKSFLVQVKIENFSHIPLEVSKGFLSRTNFISLTMENISLSNECLHYLEESLAAPESSLINLCLKNIDLGLPGTTRICKALTSNPSITVLSFSDIAFNEEAAVFIADYLKSYPLKFLVLNNASLSDKSAHYIGEGIEKNNSLISLELKGNFIQVQGAKALGKGISQHPCLETLNLEHNQINDLAFSFLIKGLKNNKTLMFLNLGHNGITKASRTILEEFISVNQTVFMIDLRKNIIKEFDLNGNIELQSVVMVDSPFSSSVS